MTLRTRLFLLMSCTASDICKRVDTLTGWTRPRHVGRPRLSRTYQFHQVLADGVFGLRPIYSDNNDPCNKSEAGVSGRTIGDICLRGAHVICACARFLTSSALHERKQLTGRRER